MIIGTFNDSQNGKITGSLRTLTLNTKLALVPIDQANDSGPHYRVLNDRLEVGAAWEKVSKTDNRYLSVRIDDPSFPRPIDANLNAQDNGKYVLLWQRRDR